MLNLLLFFWLNFLSLSSNVTLLKYTDCNPSPTVFKINVQIEGLRNGRGMVKIAFYDDHKFFPDQFTNAVHISNLNVITKNTVRLVISLPAGTYAAALIHDENENHLLDKNMFGIPQEGIGISNGLKSKFRKPTFQDAKFSVSAAQPNAPVKIKVCYL